jgi:hypothetical protein
MNCDQVFDILTRGPFPTGTPCDAGVEAHLSVCPECRRLAEALRPALELFQEAVGPEESRDLPGYWCAVATDRTQPVVADAKDRQPRVAVPRTSTQAPATKTFSALAAWRLAAALALGVTLGSLLNSRGALDGFSALPPVGKGAAAVGPSPGDPSADGQRSQTIMVELVPAEDRELAVLSAACFHRPPGPAPRYAVTAKRVLAYNDLGNLECCTRCHAANSASVPGHATLAVSQTCFVCHQADRVE